MRDTEGSGSVTLNSEGVRGAIVGFVDLVARNIGKSVDLCYFTTSPVGTEHAVADRPDGIAGLTYWRKAAAGADVSPLRAILQSDKFPEGVRAFVKARDDQSFRRDLLARIHWECGRPDFATLRQEFEDRLVVVGRERFNLPAPEARRIADLLVYRVLKKSIATPAANRLLTRAELNEAIDSGTRLALPRTAVDAFARLASGLASSFSGAAGPGSDLSAGEDGWLIDSNSLTARTGMIRRNGIETEAVNALTQSGACILVGGSGLGKSNVACTVAIARAGVFTMVDLRERDVMEMRRRLDTVVARIGGLRSSVLILEDLNHLDDPGVALSLARVVESLRRRDRALLVTCYRRPSVRLLADVGLNQGCVVECTYFSEAEAKDLVHLNGGDPTRWAPIAYAAAAGGHPQLTHAFVVGIAARGWPIQEIRAIVSRGLSSDDIDAARDAARRNLVAALPEGTRNALYRLSLAGVRFSRSLAVAVTALPPPVAQAGECLDQLVGPWIEAIGRDSYRVSPLASTFGREMLTTDEQARIHETMAIEILKKLKLDALDADAVLMHAIAGRSTYPMAMIAKSVLTADSRTLEMLAEQLTVLPLLRTDAPILADNPFVAGMLRLAQFKLSAAGGKGDEAGQIATVLFAEISGTPDDELKSSFESMALMSVLCTMGVASYLWDWMALLRRLKHLVVSDDFMSDLRQRIEGKGDDSDPSFFGSLFGIGVAGLASVAKLEHIVDELDKFDSRERLSWLTTIDKAFSDYSVFINGPWAAEQRSEGFDAAEAALRYHRMAHKTIGWNIRHIPVQCYVARTVMLDEYQDDQQGALAVLDEAVAALGEDPVLSRARAKVYWRRDQYSNALAILRSIADQIGANNPIERAYALREAAISAAKSDEWPQAEQWFLEAQTAAMRASADDMNVMAIGLGADASAAALQADETVRGLKTLAEALHSLMEVDPEASLRAAYCHRVVRHTVLWAKNHVGNLHVEIDGEPIGMLPGSCSNPDPSPTIRDHPLGPIDIAWYMLADTEISAGLDIGISTTLHERLVDGQIPILELRRKIHADVERLDAMRFSDDLASYAESIVYLSENAAELRTGFDPLAPLRGCIPVLSTTAPF